MNIISTDVIIDLMQIILLTVTALTAMLVAAFKRDHGLVSLLTLLGLIASLLVFVFIEPVIPLQATEVLLIDRYSLFFSALIIISAIVVCALAYPYFDKHNDNNEEFYPLLAMGTLGGVVLACSSHFLTFFIGMEMLSISLFALIAYPVHWRGAAKYPLEAGIKYLVLSATATGTMLFGMALIFAELGTMQFSEMGEAIAALEAGAGPLLIIGFLMLLSGIGFKLSLVPFHMWTPDVYEGAPVPVTAYIATASKAAMLGVTLRLLLLTDALAFEHVISVLAILAAVSMLVGNLLALLQNNLKRLLAYSSIGHLGYVLVAIIAAANIEADFSMESLAYYVAAYVLMTLGGFGVISALSTNERELDNLSDMQGLFWRNPWLAMIMTTVMLSLAGIPLTIGFIGKFYLFNAGVLGELWFLLLMLIIGSAIGLYYYLRVVYTMLRTPADQAPAVNTAALALPGGTHLLLGVLTAAIIVLGVYPAPLINGLQGLAGF